MKKNSIGIKGFAMSELLAASIVILLLFSILFANYLPLAAEFENRILYTNVTANYSAFYVRKIYTAAFEDYSKRTFIKETLQNNSFYTVYKKGTQETPKLITETDSVAQLQDIINKYGIEEIIITKYKLNDLKGKTSIQPYKKSDGALYGYINYLPIYKKSKQGSDFEFEPYRLIIKTSNFGYATTQLLPDSATSMDCFTLSTLANHPNEFAIVDYDVDNCGTDVVIPSYEITYHGRSGIITSITGSKDSGEYIGAFENKGITSISLSKNVTSIGNKAFKNNDISSFDFENDAPKVTQIGDEAFSGNELTRVVIPDTLNQIGKGVFANNYSLKTIEFDYNDKTSNKYISTSMFELTKDNSKFKYNKINLLIPNNVVSIGENAFKNMQFSSIEFESGASTQTIKESAFEIEDGVSTDSDNYISLTIPHTVITIGDKAFKNVKLGSLVLEISNTDGSNLTQIGNSAFELDEAASSTKSITIPKSVQRIGDSAFKNQMLSGVVLENADDPHDNDLKLIYLGSEAFSGNALRTITLPSSLAKGTNRIGSKIFGDSFTIGNNIGEIIIANDQLFNKNWCTILYGTTSCTDNSVSNIPGSYSSAHSYQYSSTTKYVTSIDNE